MLTLRGARGSWTSVDAGMCAELGRRGRSQFEILARQLTLLKFGDGRHASCYRAGFALGERSDMLRWCADARNTLKLPKDRDSRSDCGRSSSDPEDLQMGGRNAGANCASQEARPGPRR